MNFSGILQTVQAETDKRNLNKQKEQMWKTYADFIKSKDFVLTKQEKNIMESESDPDLIEENMTDSDSFSD